MEWYSRFLIFAIYGNAKDEWNSAESKRSMAEDARETKIDRSHCNGDDYPGGSRTSGPEYGHEKGYSTLFTGMSSEDAQAVVSLLQDEGVDYRYNDKNGSVQVMSDTVDKTRAELLSKGYPKKRLYYDMYRNNAGIMSTEKDKENIHCMNFRIVLVLRSDYLKGYVMQK